MSPTEKTSFLSPTDTESGALLHILHLRIKPGAQLRRRAIL